MNNEIKALLGGEAVNSDEEQSEVKREYRITISSPEKAVTIYEATGYHLTTDDELTFANAKQVCTRCNGTGWLHGCQNWSESFIKKNGSPYYSAPCACQSQNSSE